MGAESDSLPSRTSIKATCADIEDRETVVSSLLGSLSKAKRDRDQNVVQILRDRQSLHKIPQRKAELPCDEKNWLSKDLYEAEADVEVNKHCERRDSDIALYEIHPELQQANQWADRLKEIKKKNLYGELELRSRFFQECQAKYCQEIEELSRVCCEETD